MGDSLNKGDLRRLERFEDKLDNHNQEIAVIKEQNKNIIIKLDSMSKILNKKLYGNGQKGLCDIVNDHTTYFKLFGVAIVSVPPVVAIIVKLILG